MGLVHGYRVREIINLILNYNGDNSIPTCLESALKQELDERLEEVWKSGFDTGLGEDI